MNSQTQTKNFISRFLFFIQNPKNKKILIIFFLLLLLGVIIPSRFTFALPFGLDKPFKLISNLPLVFIAVFLALGISIPILLTAPFIGLVGELLKITAKGDLIKIPLTVGGDLASGGNPLIKIGLDVTMPMANMVIILGFVVIAIGTILGIESYGLRKTLPMLIIIALLINFAPVLAGVVVDFTNLIMSYFADAFDFTELSNISLGNVGNIWADLFKPLWDNWIYENLNPSSGGANDNGTPAFITGVIQAVGIGFSQVAFNVFGALTMLLIFALLVVRMIMIMLLVILSPLAFATYIIPATKSYFSKWWSQLLQWSFTGVIATFFLFLATQMLKNTKAFFPDKITPGTGWMDGVVGPLVMGVFPLIIIIIGFFASMSGGGMFASSVIKGAKLLGSKIGGWGATKGGQYIGIAGKMKTAEGENRWQRFKNAYSGSTGKEFGGKTMSVAGSLKEMGLKFKNRGEELKMDDFTDWADRGMGRKAGGALWTGAKGVGKGLKWYGGLGAHAVGYVKANGSREAKAILYKRMAEANRRSVDKAAILENDPQALKDMMKGNSFDKSAAGAALARNGHLDRMAPKEAVGLMGVALKNAQSVNPEATKEMLKYYPMFAGLIGKKVAEAIKGGKGEDARKYGALNFHKDLPGMVKENHSFIKNINMAGNEEVMSNLPLSKHRDLIMGQQKTYIKNGAEGQAENITNYSKNERAERRWGNINSAAITNEENAAMDKLNNVGQATGSKRTISNPLRRGPGSGGTSGFRRGPR